MKKIIFLLFAMHASLSAQVKKDWDVVIPEVKVLNSSLLNLSDELLIGYSGSVLFDLSTLNRSDTDGDGFADLLTRWVWVSSDGKIIYRAKSPGGPTIYLSAVLIFNDNYIVTTDRAAGYGKLIYYHMEGDEIAKTVTDHNAAIWLGGRNSSRFSSAFNIHGHGYIFGVNGHPDRNENAVILSRYSLNPPQPSFWVQQSKDLETWEDVIQVPKSPSQKEFFRIAPEN